MMLMSVRIPVLVATLAVAIAACRSTVNPHDRPSSSSSQNCRTIEHQSGVTEICGQPQTIVALGPFVLEPLLALEVQVDAFADHVTLHQGPYDNPDQQILYLGKYVTNQPVNLGIAGQPSIEALLQLQPDLILGTQFNNADEYETLSKIAPTILLKWDDAETNLTTIAETIGYPKKAQRLLAEIEQHIVTSRDGFFPFVAEHPNVLLLSTDSQLKSIHIGDSAHGLCASLLTDLGFNLVSLEGVAENQPGAPVPVSLEAITQVDDEAKTIVLLGFNDDPELQTTDNFENRQLIELKQTWEQNAIAQSLNASKAGRVYFIPAYLCLGLPGPIGTELYLNELKTQLLRAQAP
ncbi:MAG: iron-siderophore ABC transporter substrate-binding protein [Cyanobacteria bacterium P01_A01_bin.17]